MMQRLWQIGFCMLCGAAALAPQHGGSATAAAATAFPGWPVQLAGRELRALPLTDLELRFQDSFPGRVGRFADGEHEVILRWVTQGSRKLHSASDCFKAIGYTITPQAMYAEGQERWSSFIAAKAGKRLLVRERIVDAGGAQWSDVSAWYWAVQLGRSAGPWWALTVATTLPPEARAGGQ